MSATTVTTTPATGSHPVAGPGYWRGILWLTWRQHRWPILVSTAVTAGMLIWMAATASQINSGLAMCHGLGANCPRTTIDLAKPKLDHGYSWATYELNILVALPVLLGVFWGAPVLAREYEQRTLPLAWSQDISPLKWLWGKLAILGLIVTALSAALAGTAEHIAYLAHLANERSLFEGTLFQGGGWMPFTLALAWFAFGVAAGAAVRRTMPALAVVVGMFVLRTVLMVKYRPELMKPVTKMSATFKGSSTADGGSGTSKPPTRGTSQPVPDHFGSDTNSLVPGTGQAVPNTMSLSGGNPTAIDQHGHTIPYQQVMDTCISSYNKPGNPDYSYIQGCFQQHGVVGVVDKYQPANRMGTFHLIENSLNLGLMVLSLALTWWFVRTARTTV